MNKKVKIGNAQGFWGDTPTAAATLISQQPDLDYITLDYLSELSMSILAIQREKDSAAGYARDFIDVIQSLISHWQKGLKFKVITNAGGLNPRGCALACLKMLQGHELSHLKIGILTGDNVLELLKRDSEIADFNNLETGDPLGQIVNKLVTANAYVGAASIVQLLDLGADIIITGRIADPSMVVAPAAYHFKWDLKNYDLIAQATVAGHLIECGTQVTGGFSNHWHTIEHPEDLGFPWVEIDSDGTFVVSKSTESTGIVDERIVKEQLLYEISDPSNYLSPDVCLSIMNLKLSSDGENRIKVSGAAGKAPPPTLKVSATYQHGYKAEGMIGYYGILSHETAIMLKEIIRKRVSVSGYQLNELIVECFGCSDERRSSPTECIIRFAAADENKKAVEAFGKEIAPLITSGPQGLFGYTSGRPKAKPVFGYWPCLIPVDQVSLHTEILTP